MAFERPYEPPSNTVRFNTYVAQSKNRVPTKQIYEKDWLTARLVSPDPEIIDHYAKDILMRVIKIVTKDDGHIRVYAKPVMADCREEVDESDAAPVNPDGFLFEDGVEKGYFLKVFQRRPRSIGRLAAEATLET